MKSSTNWKGKAQKEAFANWALALAACLIINFCELSCKVNCLVCGIVAQPEWVRGRKQLQLHTRSSCHGSHKLPLIVCQPEAQKHQQQQQQVLPTLVNYAPIKPNERARVSQGNWWVGELVNWWLCQQWQLQVEAEIIEKHAANNCLLRVLYDRPKTRFSFIRFLYCGERQRVRHKDVPHLLLRLLLLLCFVLLLDPTLQISIVFHCFLVDTLYLPNWIKWDLCSYVIELSAQVHSGIKYCRGLSSI